MRVIAATSLVVLAVACARAGSSECPLISAINSPSVEYGAILTEYGLFFARQEGRWGANGRSRLHAVDAAGRPAPVAFGAEEASESDPAYDARRRRLCFVSTRAVQSGEALRDNGDIWCADRDARGWGTAYRLPAPINTSADEFSPSFDASGRLYFASDRAGGYGHGDIYVGEVDAVGGWAVTNLGEAVNTADGEWNVGIDASGARLIFEASSRVANRANPGDLYYSRATREGWSSATPLSRLNTDASDLMARWVGADRIVYASARAGDGDVNHYWAVAEDFEPLEPTLVAVARSSGHVVMLDPLTLRERRRVAAGVGPHESAASEDGRLAVVPLHGVYPQPHDAPVEQRPRFLERPSAGYARVDLRSGRVDVVAMSACVRPHGVAAHAQARRVWITCETEGKVVELDAHGSTVREFELGQGVHKVLLSPDGRSLVTTNPDRGTLQSVDLGAGSVRTMVLGAGAEGLTLDRAGAAAWVATSTGATLCRVSLAQWRREWCVPVGAGAPIAVALVETRNEVWVSRLASADVAVLSAADGALLQVLKLPSGALGLAVNRRDGLVYATLPRRNEVVAIDITRREIVARAGGIMEGDDLDLVPAAAFASRAALAR